MIKVINRTGRSVDFRLDGFDATLGLCGGNVKVTIEPCDPSDGVGTNFSSGEVEPNKSFNFRNYESGVPGIIVPDKVW